MTIDETTEIECDHEWVNARCAKCAVVSSERRLREFLEHSSADYASKHGGPGPNAHHDVDLHRVIVSTLLNVADYLEQRENRQNPVERVIGWIDWPLRVASILDIVEKLLKGLGISLKRGPSQTRTRQRSKFYG